MLAFVDEEERTDPDGADRRTALADQRTSLAGERTLLAWWRTGLTAVAVALAVGRLLPELAPHATKWPYVALGVGFALYGIAMFLLGTQRMGVFDRAAGTTEEHSAGDGVLVAFTGAGVILGIATLAVIVGQ
jgi:putative membrane protein